MTSRALVVDPLRSHGHSPEQTAPPHDRIPGRSSNVRTSERKPARTLRSGRLVLGFVHRISHFEHRVRRGRHYA